MFGCKWKEQRKDKDEWVQVTKIIVPGELKENVHSQTNWFKLNKKILVQPSSLAKCLDLQAASSQLSRILEIQLR